MVEDLFGEPAVPQLLVVLFQAFPVGAEGGEAGVVDVVEPDGRYQHASGRGTFFREDRGRDDVG